MVGFFFVLGSVSAMTSWVFIRAGAEPFTALIGGFSAGMMTIYALMYGGPSDPSSR
jgi:hypothetical protein